MSARLARTLTCAGLGLVVVLTIWLSGVRALSVESGSMGSALPTGSLAITRPAPAAAVSVGDVVSVVGQDGQRVTHRVLQATQSSEPGSDEVSLLLKGDANASADHRPVAVTSVDSVVVGIPHAGRVVSALTSGPALIAVGGTALLLLLRRHWRPSLALAVGASVAFAATGATGAVFTDSAEVDSGNLTSGRVNPPAVPTASQAATTGTVNIGFSSTTVGTLSAPASSYEVYRYTTATGGTGTLVCTTTTTFTCTEARTALTTGTHYYAVRAKFATNWSADSTTRRSYNHDATGPTVAVTRPLAGSSGGATNLRNSVTGGCTSGGVACGTAADTGGGTVSSVQYTLLGRSTTISTGAVALYCWSGSAWVSSSTGVCTFANTTGTTTWRVPGTVSTAYPNPPTGTTSAFVLTIRSTDSFGNQSTTTVNFSY